MRVTNVEMYSSTFEEPINFSLRATDPNAKYQVKTIIGLDAEEIIPKYYGQGLATSPKYYDFSLKPRDIILRIVLNPNYRLQESPSDVRDDLYRAISADRTGRVVLHFRSGGAVVSRIFGSIIKFEVPYFAKLPEVQFTVRCNDPMFRGVNPVHFAPNELVTVNPVLLPDSLSTSPHGFTMQVTFKAAAPSFTIQDVQTNPEWIFKVIPSGGFLNGDALFFSSEFSNKYLYMVRSGVATQLIDKVQPNSMWPIIFPGQNSFWFVDLASINWNFIDYYAAYWGV